jgi:hypothetical protein
MLMTSGRQMFAEFFRMLIGKAANFGLMTVLKKYFFGDIQQIN